MSNNLALFPRRLQTAAQRPRSRRWPLGWVLVMGLAWLAPAQAENVLESISFNPGPGGQVDVIMTLTEPPVDPKLFTTETPPRIAVDFDNTRSALAERRINVGVGAASAISAIEAAGRTRVVVELLRSSSYSTRVDGNTLTLSVGNGGSASGSAPMVTNNDPTKAVIGGRPSLNNVDFRRGKNGEGRVVLTFSGDGSSTDIRREGSKVVLEVSNAEVPTSVREHLDVTDFATPVEAIETKPRGNGARVEIRINGQFEQLAYQTGNDYVVEIAPVKQLSEAEKRLKEPEYSGERVTFNFQDIPVRSVLQLIADVSQLNVVVADSVQGNVTLRLVNVPWDQALDIILQAKGLDKRSRGNVMWIAPTSEIAAREQALEDARIALEDRSPLVSEYISINYGNAKDIAELLTSDSLRAQATGGQVQQRASGFLSTRGSVTFDTRTNTLLVNDTPQKIQEIKDLIKLLDRAVDQVLIESRIVIADESFGRQLGAKFGLSGGYEDNRGNIITTGGSSNATDQMNNVALINRLGGSTSGLPVGFPSAIPDGVAVPSLANRLNVNLPVASPAGSFALAVLGQDYLLDLELSALHEEGRGEVISSPRVITANQREAVIRQGDEVGYVTTTQSATGTTSNVQFKDVLLELKVTPTITQDERVFLVMNVKKDELKGFVTTTDSAVPQITKREINTAVLVENGQTVVLGGVYEFKTRKDLTKVPFLGDLPAVGNFFKNTSRSTDKAELLIFVTPKILQQGGR